MESVEGGPECIQDSREVHVKVQLRDRLLWSCRKGGKHIGEILRLYFQTFLRFEYKEEAAVKDNFRVSILENLVDVV